MKQKPFIVIKDRRTADWIRRVLDAEKAPCPPKQTESQ